MPLKKMAWGVAHFIKMRGQGSRGPNVRVEFLAVFFLFLKKMKRPSAD